MFFTCAAYWLGPTPVAEARLAIDRLRREARGPLEEGATATADGGLLAMQGHFDEARQLLRRTRQTFREFGLALYASGESLPAGMVELAAGDFEAAARLLGEGAAELREMGETGYLSTNLAVLATRSTSLGRYDEAGEPPRSRANEMTQSGLMSPPESAGARLSAACSHGGVWSTRPFSLAREAIGWAETTDSLPSIADAYASYAEVLRLAGRNEEAVAKLEHALDLYERKGHRPFAERARATLAELRG